MEHKVEQDMAKEKILEPQGQSAPGGDAEIKVSASKRNFFTVRS